MAESATPIKDILDKLGVGTRELPPDDPIYSQGAVVFIPRPPPPPPAERTEPSMTTRVVNARDRVREGEYVPEPNDVYIGHAMPWRPYRLRKSRWANPFRIDRPGRPRDGTRDEVIAKFSAYLFGPDGGELRDAVPVELRDKVLVCWCVPPGQALTAADRPFVCHGQVLAALADGSA
jgi:hypothetical protein